MSVDERIVAMRFSNSQFEKGVRKSLKTLQELREASNLDDVAASMRDTSKEINQNLNFESTTKSAGIFSKAMTGLGKVARTTFNAATFPLQALGRSLQSLGKYTRAVLGIDIASQLIHTGENVIRAFTIDPLKSGWNEYELKMDSIKTIMTGTVKTYTDAMTKKDPSFLYDEEKHLEYVKQGLEELNTYADKTIYSFQDMTSNIGKFTNAGVEFDTAVDAIKGISNAAAHAGQGSSQASSAMYNLSQALGMGYLGMMDWRSIENANMATLTFKQTLIDLGVALGKLKKDEKSGKLFVIDENGKVDDKLEVTAENLRETLSKKWVNKDVLLGALGIYSGEYSASQLQEMYKLTEEEAAALAKIGEEASLAATQVRTFSKMWDALKEAAQSGWAISWELIFGDMNEATNFWTSLNNRFSNFLDGISESRNNILREWRGEEKWWDPWEGVQTWKKRPGKEDGREILIEGLNNLLDVIKSLGDTVSKAWESVFGKLTSGDFLNMTKNFTKFTGNVKKWLGDANQNGSRLNKIVNGFKGFFGLFKGAGNFIKGAITTISDVLHLDKLIDLGVDLVGKAGEWLTGIGDKISELWSQIGESEIVQNLSKWFSDLWTEVSKFFTEVDPKTGKTGFDVAIDNIVGFINSLATDVEKAWTEFTNSDFYKNASKLFSDLWTSVIGFFQPKVITGKMGNTWTEKSAFQEMIDNVLGWFDGAWKTISAKWTEFTNSDFYKNASKLFSDLWTSVIGFFQPKERFDDRGFMLYDNRSPFQEMIDNIVGWFNSFKETISQKWTEFQGTDFYKNASTFFSGIFESIRNFFSPTENEDGTFEDSPCAKLLGSIKTWFDNNWSGITEVIENIISGVTGFFSRLWNAIFGSSESGGTGSLSAKGFPAGTRLIASALGTSDVIYNSMKTDAEAEPEQKANAVVSFFERIATAISDFITKVKDWNGWSDIGGFFREVFGGIGGAIEAFGTITGITTAESLGKAIAQIIESLGTVIATILDVANRALQGDPAAIAESVIAILVAVALRVTDLILALKTAGGASAGVSLAGFGAGIFLIAEAISILSKLDWGQLLKGGLFAGGIGAGLGGIGILISGIADTVKEVSATPGLKTFGKIVSNLLTDATLLIALGELLDKLPSVFAAYDNTNGKMEGIADTINSLAILLLSVAGSITLLKIAGVKAENAAEAAGSFLVGIASVGLGEFLALGIENLIGAWVQLDEKGLLSRMDSAKQAAESFGGILHGFWAGLVGEDKTGKGLKETVDNMAIASESADVLDEEKVAKLQRVMEAFKAVSSNLPENPTNLETWFTNRQNIEGFASGIRAIGEALSAFSLQIMTITDVDKTLSGIEMLESFIRATYALEALNIMSEKDAYGLAGDMFSFLTAFSNKLSVLEDQGQLEDFLSGFSSFGEVINTWMTDGVGDINVDPIVESWAGLLITKFSESIKNGVKSALGNLAIDASDTDSIPLLSYQNGTISLSGTVTIDQSNINSIVSAINDRGNSIIAAINGMGERIDNVVTAVRGLKLVVNTGLISEIVDKNMGTNAIIYGRTGAAGKF